MNSQNNLPRSRAALLAIAILIASPIAGGLLYFRERLVGALEDQILKNQERSELALSNAFEQNLALIELQISTLAADSDIFLASKSVLFANNALFLMGSLRDRNPLLSQIVLFREDTTPLSIEATIPNELRCDEPGWSVFGGLATHCTKLRGYGTGEGFLLGGVLLKQLLEHVQSIANSDVRVEITSDTSRPSARPILSLPGIALSFSHQASEQSEYLESEVTWLGIWISASFASLVLLMLWLFRIEKRRLQLENERTQKELHAIRARLDPHFLFNALNSIVNSIELDPTQASEMAANLANLYRKVTDSTRKDTHSLEDELQLVDLYLSIEKIRFGKRLTWAIRIPESQLSCRVPTLALQLLVENAIKHGISKSRSGGEIEISSEISDSWLLSLSVKNSGAPLSPSFKTGTGLSSLSSMLELLYGPRAALLLRRVPDGMTEASFKVPTGEAQ